DTPPTERIPPFIIVISTSGTNSIAPRYRSCARRNSDIPSTQTPPRLRQIASAPMHVYEQPTSAQRMQQSVTYQSAFTGCYTRRTVWRHTMTANAYGSSQHHQAHAEGCESSQASAEDLSPMDVENALELYRAIIK